MSRVAKNPIVVPAGIEAHLVSNKITVKGKLGTLSLDIHPLVEIKFDPGIISVLNNAGSPATNALSGTTRANIANMVLGVSKGYERKLILTGVGYRAQAKGEVLNLSLGFSHPVEYCVPQGITVETPSQTEIVIKGCDKQKVGQVAANIRAYRPPEPYKGKGVRYSDEVIIRKEAKKK
jgi:large subunit ribosomal protein L6